MKTQVNYDVDPDTRIARIPAVMINVGTQLVTDIVNIMVIYGLDKVDIGKKVYGDGYILEPKTRTIKELTADCPVEVVETRKIISYHLAQMMSIVGVISVEVTPTPEDLSAIRTRWQALTEVEGENGPADSTPESRSDAVLES